MASRNKRQTDVCVHAKRTTAIGGESTGFDWNLSLMVYQLCHRVYRADLAVLAVL